jgi:hypothetical protein
MITGELFVEDIGGLWECGGVIKLDLVTIRPDAPPPGKVLACRLVAPREDLKRIAKTILELMGDNQGAIGTDSASEATRKPQLQRDEVVVARTE